MMTLFDLRKTQDQELIKELKKHFKEDIHVRNLKNEIRSCIGCWSCWVKTPGNCVFKDAMADFYEDYLNSDRVIVLMDTEQGFINHVAKAFFDRTIPHYMPYIEITDKECHHYARYDAYPELYFYYDTDSLTEKEERVIEDYLYRTAYHFQSKPYRIHDKGKIEVEYLVPRNAFNKQVPFERVKDIENLIIYNGSPRLNGSNTGLILSHIQERVNHVEVRDLKDKDKWDIWAETFEKDRHVLFFMPLYVHAMPSHVMAFIEKLKPSEGSIGFLVQSGFPESSQSYYLEAYFEQLSKRLNRKYLGTAIKGGVEGLQIRPEKNQLNIMEPFIQLIYELMATGAMKEEIIEKLSQPKVLPKKMLVMFKLLEKTKLVNFFWDRQLKANEAFENRYSKPYEREAISRIEVN